MLTIKFTRETQTDIYNKDTFEEAQSYARQWMNYYDTTEVFVTACPQLKIFTATQFEITKETR